MYFSRQILFYTKKRVYLCDILLLTDNLQLSIMNKMIVAVFAALFTVSISSSAINQEPQKPAESKCGSCPKKKECDKKEKTEACKKDKGETSKCKKKKACCKNKKAAKKACKKAGKC